MIDWKGSHAKVKALEKTQDTRNDRKDSELLIWHKPQKTSWAQGWCVRSFMYIHNAVFPQK